MADNKPTHRLLLVSERLDRYGKPQSQFTEICALWTNDKGTISGTIPTGMFLSGRVAIVSAEKKADEAAAEEPAFSEA